MPKKSDWERCVEFHGHACGGLAIGYKAARYAIRLLNLKFSEDENIVCICENDACGVDAIQGNDRGAEHLPPVIASFGALHRSP